MFCPLSQFDKNILQASRALWTINYIVLFPAVTPLLSGQAHVVKDVGK